MWDYSDKVGEVELVEVIGNTPLCQYDRSLQRLPDGRDDGCGH
ncbi:MAG: hypothetical protein PHG00_11870 [Methylococcales bacterium]|nr:hypothetical protein [Methylococcales bacterium]